MSVPPGNRQKSSMQFIETADKIEDLTMRTCRKWPKSYMFIITQRTLNLASEIYERAQRANAIIPKIEREREERLIHLQNALGATYAFARKVERAYRLFPLCGEKKDLEANTVDEKSAKLLEEFMNLCLDEEEALKGNIQYTRKLTLPGTGQKAAPKQ